MGLAQLAKRRCIVSINSCGYLQSESSRQQRDADQAIQSLAIAKTIPDVWNQLTQAEKDKVTLIMQACLVASHWVHDDGNNFYTGINQLGNTHKSWNPNHIEGGVGMGIAASYYLGGATTANNFLVNFNYDNFMAQVQTAGLTSIHWVFSQTGKTALEAAVRNTFTYNGYGLNQPFYWLKTLADKMYNRTVAPTGASGKGYIVSGASSLPNQGQAGMANEFESVDGPGQRSDIQYVSKGWNNSLINRFTLEHFNGWGTGADRNAVANKYSIGTTDFIYKITNGYHSYSNGGNKGILYASGLHNIMGYFFLKELWDKEYGGGSGGGAPATKYEAENAILTGVSVASSKSGYSGTGYIAHNSFDQTGDNIKFTVNVASAGQYQLKVRYAGDSNKQQYLLVNGVSQPNLVLPNSSSNWATETYGNIQLNAGSNTIEIRKHFGWNYIDYIELTSA
jgi:hypothetical protein